MKIIKVNLKQNSYNIYLGKKIFSRLAIFLKNLSIGNFALVITSKSVFKNYSKQLEQALGNFEHQLIVVPDGEPAKSKEELFRIIDALVKIDKINRKIFIVCLGGGTVGDVGGFAAAIYKRGIPYVQVPTTLLAQIDASIGGKTAIDLKEAKNILGAFYQPKAVFIDPVFLNTLSEPVLKDGIAEAVKYAAIKDECFFDFLRENYREILCLSYSAILRVIDTCVRIKAKIVEEDEKEKKGIRTILNFGHTLAHSIEAALKYRKISHGQAVSVGMVYAAYLSYKLGYCDINKINILRGILTRFDLPVELRFPYKDVYRAMSYDKKFVSGKFRLVLLKKIGNVVVVDGIDKRGIENALINFSRAI